jgi:hypothetical protein
MSLTTKCYLGIHMSVVVKLSIIALLLVCLIMPVRAEPLMVKTTVVDDHTIEVSIKNLGAAMPSTKVDILVVDKYGYLMYKGSRTVTFNQNEQKDLVYTIPDLPLGKYPVQTLIYKDTNSAIQPTYYYNWNAAIISIEAQPSPSSSVSPTKSPSPLISSPYSARSENMTTMVVPLSNATNVTAFESGSRGTLGIPMWMLVVLPIAALFALALFLLLNDNSQRRHAITTDYDNRYIKSGVTTEESQAKYAQKTRIVVEDDENPTIKKYDTNSGNTNTSRFTRIPIDDSESDEAKR